VSEVGDGYLDYNLNGDRENHYAERYGNTFIDYTFEVRNGYLVRTDYPYAYGEERHVSFYWLTGDPSAPVGALVSFATYFPDRESQVTETLFANGPASAKIGDRTSHYDSQDRLEWQTVSDTQATSPPPSMTLRPDRSITRTRRLQIPGPVHPS
jgi:hypothetical protein